MSAFCAECKGSGESGQYGILDCQKCTAATERAALDAHLLALGRLHERDLVWEAYKLGQAKAVPVSQPEITRLDVLSLIREHTHRCYVAGVDMLEVDPKHMREIEDGLRSLFAWKPLNDVQWMNIVNHDHAYHSMDKEDAVHLAVKMTEAKCKEVNGGNFAAPANNNTEKADDR